MEAEVGLEDELVAKADVGCEDRRWSRKCVVARVILFVPSGAGRGTLPGQITESDVEDAERESVRLSMSRRMSAALTSAVDAASSRSGRGPGVGRVEMSGWAGLDVGDVVRCHGVAGAIGTSSGELSEVELS